MNKTKLPADLPPINMQAMTSSAIDACGYCPTTKRLAVTFKGGSTYHYYNVPVKLYDGLLAAKSAGKYVGSFIMAGNKFNGEKKA